MSIPKMRTLPEAARLISEMDSGTCLNLTGLRRIVNRGDIAVTMVGKKRLIDFNQLLELLQNPERAVNHGTETQRGVIRPISERPISGFRNEAIK